MDVEKLLITVMEKYPGKDPDEILTIVERLRLGIKAIEKKAMNLGEREIYDVEVKQTPALTASAPTEELAPKEVDRMADLKAQYKGNWAKPPKKCIDEEKIYCAICGKGYDILTKTHINTHSNMSVDEYKQLCGYKPGDKLMSKDYLERSRHKMRKGGEVYEKRQQSMAEKKKQKDDASSGAGS
ncbi:MucR family transcriptional regulator [Desulfonatronum parangueonense]